MDFQRYSTMTPTGMITLPTGIGYVCSYFLSFAYAQYIHTLATESAYIHCVAYCFTSRTTEISNLFTWEDVEYKFDGIWYPSTSFKIKLHTSLQYNVLRSPSYDITFLGALLSEVKSNLSYVTHQGSKEIWSHKTDVC